MSTPAPALTVVIPCWKDAEAVGERLAELGSWDQLGASVEIIVAEVNETGKPSCGELFHFPWLKIIPCHKANRGSQLLAGVAAATGAGFLFHHADTPWSVAHLQAVCTALAADQDAGGAFYRDTGAMYPRWKMFTGLVRWWHRHCGNFLGDQSVFASRSRYERVGGFRPLPLLEDLDFSRRLRRSGRVTLLDPPVRHSLRRFAKGRGLRLRLLNATIILLFKLGVSPDRLHRLYYSVR